MSAAASVPRLLGSAAVLATWLGAALLVATAVAPAAFAVLPTRALAGALVGRVLPVVFVAGMACGAAAAALGWDTASAFARARVALPLGAALCCAVAHFAVGPRIATLRAEIGPSVEALATTDPRRVAFGRLHGYSVAWMGAGMLCAGGAIALTILAARNGKP